MEGGLQEIYYVEAVNKVQRQLIAGAIMAIYGEVLTDEPCPNCGLCWTSKQKQIES